MSMGSVITLVLGTVQQEIPCTPEVPMSWTPLNLMATMDLFPECCF